MNFLKFKRIICRLRSVRLTRKEREDLRSNFLMQTGLADRAPSYFTNIFPRYASATALGVLMVLIGFSPLAIAAQKSVPGDLLHPIKIIVNEPVQKAVLKITKKERPQESVPSDIQNQNGTQITEGTQKTPQTEAGEVQEEQKNKKQDKVLRNVDKSVPKVVEEVPVLVPSFNVTTKKNEKVKIKVVPHDDSKEKEASDIAEKIQAPGLENADILP